MINFDYNLKKYFRVLVEKIFSYKFENNYRIVFWADFFYYRTSMILISVTLKWKRIIVVRKWQKIQWNIDDRFLISDDTYVSHLRYLISYTNTLLLLHFFDQVLFSLTFSTIRWFFFEQLSWLKDSKWSLWLKDSNEANNITIGIHAINALELYLFIILVDS